MSVRTFVVRNRKIMLLTIVILMCVSGFTRMSLRYADRVDSYVEYTTREKDRPIRDFIVDTTGFRIPDMDPYDDSIWHLIGHSKPITCSDTPALTFIHKTTLKINQSALVLYYHNDLDRCLYQGISWLGNSSEEMYTQGSRNSHLSDQARGKPITTYATKEEAGEFKDEIQVKFDFIYVVCYNTKGQMIYTNHHTAVVERNDIEKRCEQRRAASHKREKLKENLNILMIGVQSVSRLNFVRQMVQTRRYLMTNMSAIELKGYNALAGGTADSLVPMLTGKFAAELDSGSQGDPHYGRTVESIWKKVTSRGYRTLYATDTPCTSSFNDSLVDYHMCPFSFRTARHRSVGTNARHCSGNRLKTELILDHVKEFVTVFNDRPNFALSFISHLTRDDINKAAVADALYYKFIRSLHEQRLLNNTVLIFFSDHGMRFGPIKDTYIGTLEERLPFMYLVFPDWFAIKYPTIDLNLRINQKRLTTPFDIFETLANILNFKGVSETDINRRSISLLNEIHSTRTCDKAAIPPYWCSGLLQEIAVNTSDLAKIADSAVQQINRELKPHQSTCTYLFRGNITGARLIVSRPVDNSTGIYKEPQNYHLVTFLTMPGNGRFEVAVPYGETETESKDSSKILGNIRRMDDYSGQPTCIQSHQLQKFCFCH